MDPELFMPAAVAAARRHVAVLAQFALLVEQAIGADPRDTRVRSGLLASLNDLARDNATTEHEVISREIEDVTYQATRRASADLDKDERTEPSAGSRQYAQQIRAHLASELATQSDREVRQALRRFDDFMHAVRVAATAESVSVISAQSRALIARSAPESFQFKDRIGRRIPSDRFVKLAWRHALLTLANEVYLAEAADLGATGADVVGPEKDLGVRVAFTGSQTYADIRAEYFHPNTLNRLRAS